VIFRECWFILLAKVTSYFLSQRSLALKILAIILSLGISAFAQSWVSHTPPTSGDLVAVFFTSQSRGFIAGDAGYLASTDDGGRSWQKYDLRTTADINEIYFRNDDNGYVVAGRLLYVTEDGGRTWRETRIYRNADFRGGTPELISIRFWDKKHGLAIGSVVNRQDEVVDSLVMRTADGGDTWQRVLVPTKAEVFHLDVAGDDHGWIVGDKGLILATRDRGASWEIQKSGITRALFNVDFRDKESGYAVGGGGTILRTDDGGTNWFKVASPYTETLKRVNFTDDKNGYIVGHKGTVLRTSDKGRNWIRQDARTKSDLYGLFIAKKFGWAVGAGGSNVEFQR
jgi:photosystem II stability/assembly factor-like uncharacterized protein